MLEWTSTLFTVIVLMKGSVGVESCPGHLNATQGLFFFTSNSSKICNWVFGNDNLRSDVILSLQILPYIGINHNLNVKLPDDTDLNIASDNAAAAPDPWCGLFVKKPKGNEVICQSGVNFGDRMCQNQLSTSESVTWPPRMQTSGLKSTFIISFALLPCPRHKHYPVRRTQATAATIKVEPGSTSKSETLMIVAIILDSVLVLTFVVVFAVLFKFRTGMRRSAEQITAEPAYVDMRPIPNNQNQA